MAAAGYQACKAFKILREPLKDRNYTGPMR